MANAPYVTFVDLITPRSGIEDEDENKHVDVLNRYLAEGWKMVSAVSMGDVTLSADGTVHESLLSRGRTVQITRFYFQR